MFPWDDLRYLTGRYGLMSVFLLVVGFMADKIEGQADVPVTELLKITPAGCNMLGANTIFEVASLSCLKCPRGQVASADGFECECGGNGRVSYTISNQGDGPQLRCFDCTTQNLLITQDRRFCIPCGNISALGTVSVPSGSRPAPNSSDSSSTSATIRGAQRHLLQVDKNNSTDSDPGNRTNTTNQTTTDATEQVASPVLSAPNLSQCGCPVGYVPTDYDATGNISLQAGKYCVPCPFNSYVDPLRPFVCTPCPDPYMRRSRTGTCQCTDEYVEDSVLIAGTLTADIPFVGLRVCIKRSVAESLNAQASTFAAQSFFDTIDVDGAIQDSTKVDRSLPFMKHFLAAATKCSDTRHWKSCQALSNLCVLNLYATTSPACRLLSELRRPIVIKDVNGFSGWTAGFPWLLYDSSSREVLESDKLNRAVALQGVNSDLNLTLTAYSLDGTFMGMQRVTTQLILCQGDERVMSRYSKFGTNMVMNCRVDLQKLVQEYDEPLFYELWMDDNLNRDGTVRASGPALYPVPVIIGNYRDGSDSPNSLLVDSPDLELGQGSEGDTALSRIVLHRRFFLWDNISGRRVLDAAARARLTSSGAAQAASSDAVVVRWAKYVELRVKLRQDDGDTKVDESIRIFPPYLLINYEQQIVSTIPTEPLPMGDSREDLRYPEIEFRSAYTMDLSNFWRVSMILFIVLVILVVVAFGIKVSVRNQSFSLSPPDGVLADFVGTLADAFFWGLFLMCGYWFFFFKLQSNVEVLLPLKNPHPDYLIIVIVTIVCKILQVMLLVYRQCTVDVFFIDWEKERASDDKPQSSTTDKDKALNANVSVWRSILIANEWCEMQGKRHTDIDFTLMFLLLFLAGLRFEFLATPQPDTEDLSEGSLNYALRFFSIAMWYFLVVLIQLMWKFFSYRFLQDPLDLFVDLCQLTNISTFILDEQFHGYYIHGRAVHPHTDVNMHTMQSNLQAESDGNLPYRGLTQRSREELNGASDQVFEMYVTEKIRDEYASQFSRLTANANAGGQGGRTRNAELVSRAYHNINTYLQTNVIDEIVNTYSSEVQAPDMIHKILGMPPPKIRENPVLLRDNSQLFARTLFYGIEYDLVIFDLVIFIMWDLFFKNVFIAALLTYIVAHALIELRCNWGSSNVAAKTLVDERFLV